MNVLMVLNRYYPMIGGAETQCQKLVNEMKRVDTEMNVSIVTSNHDGTQLNRTLVDGSPVYRLPLSPFGVFGFYIRLLRFLFVTGRKFDVIHCHNISNVGVLCGCVARILGKRCILKLTVDGELDLALNGTGFVGLMKSMLLRFALSKSVVVALTNSAVEEIKRNNIRRFEIIPNGIDVVALKKLVGNRRYLYDCGYVGRFSDQKRIGFLVTAFKESNTRSLLLVGGGEHQKHYSDADLVSASIVESGGLIVARGAQNPPIDFYKDVKVYVSASAKEGLSNSLLEALALDMPCIVSDIPSHREMKEKNPKAQIYLFKSLSELNCHLLNQDIFECEVPNSCLSADYKIENVGRRYLELYKRNVTV